MTDLVALVADQRIANVVEAANLIASATAPDGGLCLPVTAAISHVLATAGLDITAVCGSYRGNAHWWVRCGDLILDATRDQFDKGPLIFPASESGKRGYCVDTEYPPGWTREHVILECRRAFYFTEAADQFGEQLLRLLDMALAEGSEEPCPPSR